MNIQASSDLIRYGNKHVETAWLEWAEDLDGYLIQRFGDKWNYAKSCVINGLKSKELYLTWQFHALANAVIFEPCRLDREVTNTSIGIPSHDSIGIVTDECGLNVNFKKVWRSDLHNGQISVSADHEAQAATEVMGLALSHLKHHSPNSYRLISSIVQDICLLDSPHPRGDIISLTIK